MNIYEKTTKISILVFSDVGSKQMPFSYFLPRAEGDLSTCAEHSISRASTWAGIKLPVRLAAGPCHLPCCFPLPSSGHETLSGLCLCHVAPHLLDRGDWQLWLATTPGGWDKTGELCVQVVGQRRACSRHETGLAALACHGARHARYTPLVLYNIVLLGVRGAV